MDKKTLKRQLTSYAKGAAVISTRRIEDFLGLGHNKTAELLKGLEAVDVGNAKKYFISDVAERIIERSVRNDV